MILPNFLVVGTQKAGTTWLYQMLKQHPDVYVPETKELNFFSMTPVIGAAEVEEYSRKHFSGHRGQAAIGEASPDYFCTSTERPQWLTDDRKVDREIPRKVLDVLGPRVRLIVSFKDPVERAVSAFFHHLQRGRVKPGENILEIGHKFGIVHNGFYYEHLKKWLEYYGLESFLVLVFENTIAGNGTETMRRVFEFIGVDPSFVPRKVESVVYKGSERLRRGDDYYCPGPGKRRESPEGDDLEGWVKVISARDIEGLREIYREDIEKLSGAIGEDLSIWLEG